MKTMQKDVFASPARLSDFAPRGGDYTPMAELEGQELILMAAQPQSTKYGEGYLLTLTTEDKSVGYQVLTSAMVVCEQIGKALSELEKAPLTVRFERVPTANGSCWVIS